MLGDARCAVHLDDPATDVCSRCGNYVCVDCYNVVDDDTLCGDCVERVGHTRKYSPRAVWALVLALITLSFFLPTSIPAVILGHMELAAIKRGDPDAPASGRNLALGAVVVGWIGNVLLLVGGICLISMLMDRPEPQPMLYGPAGYGGY